MTALLVGGPVAGRLYHGAVGWDAAAGKWVVVSPDTAAPIEADTLAEALAELRRVAGAAAE